MKYLIPIFLTIILFSCGNDNSELYLILRDENKELFDKNNELVKSIQEKNQMIEMKMDSIEQNQENKLLIIDKEINRKQEDLNILNGDYEVKFEGNPMR